MPLNLNESSEFGTRVRRRLSEEAVGWLTTVTAGGTPLPSLVWFLHDDDDTLLVWSQPAKPKLRAIEANAAVGWNFNSTSGGGDMIVMKGSASVDTSERPGDQKPAYLAKYGKAILSLGYSAPEKFFDDYSVPIRITLHSVRGF